MKLPQIFIDDILSKSDIVDIISPRIALKKTGKNNYSALCPFHSEKTPSFSVSQQKQFYFCFGCRASGNAIGFLMAYDRMSFLEAVETLAKRLGMELPKQYDDPQAKISTSLFSLLKKAAEFYQAQLQLHQPAKSYLQQRGVNEEMIRRFGLGYAPNSWDFLKTKIGKNAAINELLIQAGLLNQKSDKKYFDRFRQRIMFPIRNYKGQIIAFGGRSLGKELPKYLNSPETSLFHKSHELYGLYESLQTNSKLERVLIVEGYLDVIALHQFGITYTVGTLGTSTSSHHLHRLFRYSSNIIFCFDGDRAGSIAAWRALLIALPLMRDGLNVNFLFLPKGEDPDSLIRKIGKYNFEIKIDQAISLADFFFMRLQKACNTNKIEGKAKLANMAEELLEKMPLGIFRELMYEKLATILGMDVAKISHLHALHQQSHQPPVKERERNKRNELIPPVRLALSLLLQKPQLLLNITVPPEVKHVKFVGIPTLLRLMEIISENPEQNTGSLLEYCRNQKQRELLAELATIKHLIPVSHWKDELQGALIRIVDLAQEHEIQELLAKGNRVELSKDEKSRLQLLLKQRNTTN